MKVLIDENLPRKLAGHLKGHECRTVAECGWAGKKNGELLSLAEPQFDVLLTLDKNIPYQQDLKLGRIAILIVRAPSNRIQDLLPVIPDCLIALQSIEPGHVVRVGDPPTR
jgi:predicted nuclease of predicted toxin-antitoxin system